MHYLRVMVAFYGVIEGSGYNTQELYSKWDLHIQDSMKNVNALAVSGSFRLHCLSLFMLSESISLSEPPNKWDCLQYFQPQKNMAFSECPLTRIPIFVWLHQVLLGWNSSDIVHFISTSRSAKFDLYQVEFCKVNYSWIHPKS